MAMKKAKAGAKGKGRAKKAGKRSLKDLDVLKGEGVKGGTFAKFTRSV